MPLATGTRLGSYEIAEPLGAGGMGEVYRARDTKLNRDVAHKILPELFAADPDRLARFRREAQVLASLNHLSQRASACLSQRGERASEKGPYVELRADSPLMPAIVSALSPPEPSAKARGA